MNAGFERAARTHQRLDGEGTRGIGGVGEKPRPIDGEASLGQHALRPVEQAQPFLRLELDRLKPFGFEHARDGYPLAIDEEEALSDKRESEVSERRKIARSTDRTPIRNGWQQVTPEELNDAFDDGRTDT